jgi:uncharacterized metal-binding protein
MERLKTEILPGFCPMRNSPRVIKDTIKKYQQSEVYDLYKPATITEKEAYENIRGTTMAIRPRIKELIELGKLMDARKIGIAFCVGLRDEAGRLTDVLEAQGFTVASVMCKCGGTDKTMLGMSPEDKIGDPKAFEAGCNPVLQAELLNRARTEINVIVGLCIGHDMLFNKFSKAPVTTLIVKDRLLGHNPVAALYSGYHKGVIQSQRRK